MVRNRPFTARPPDPRALDLPAERGSVPRVGTAMHAGGYGPQECEGKRILQKVTLVEIEASAHLCRVAWIVRSMWPCEGVAVDGTVPLFSIQELRRAGFFESFEAWA